MSKCRFYVDGRCIIKESQIGRFDICVPAGCTLYQTAAQQMFSLRKAWQRFMTLPLRQQKEYKDIYYHGRNPWECQPPIKTMLNGIYGEILGCVKK